MSILGAVELQASRRTSSIPWAIVCGVGALLLLSIPMSVTALLASAGWSGCLLGCVEETPPQVGLFWGSVGLLLAFVADIALWATAGWRRFERRWVIAAAALMVISVLIFFLL